MTTEDVTLFLDPHPVSGWVESSICNNTGLAWRDSAEHPEFDSAVKYLIGVRNALRSEGASCVLLVDGDEC